jgi:hypothetical protein
MNTGPSLNSETCQWSPLYESNEYKYVSIKRLSDNTLDWVISGTVRRLKPLCEGMTITNGEVSIVGSRGFRKLWQKAKVSLVTTDLNMYPLCRRELGLYYQRDLHSYSRIITCYCALVVHSLIHITAPLETLWGPIDVYLFAHLLL